jgi:8-oxo-dGTP diphosphatase
VDDAEHGSWILYRQDDNGNRYEMARFDSREAAEAEAARYQVRGHKQLYYVEPA